MSYSDPHVNLRCRFLSEKCFAVADLTDIGEIIFDVFRCSTMELLWTQSNNAAYVYQSEIRPKDGNLLLEDYTLLDMNHWQRLRPPAGRKYHPRLVSFAADGRYVGLLDTATEKVLPGYAYVREKYIPRFGWVGAEPKHGVNLHLAPSALTEVHPDLIQLWAQVAVRGELGLDGEFVKWDEPTWEKKRQELAAIPPPHADLPFPGYVAQDKLHWLRAEYEAASEMHKLQLATELLRRAEATGNNIEAVRWRTILASQIRSGQPTGPQ